MSNIKLKADCVNGEMYIDGVKFKVAETPSAINTHEIEEGKDYRIINSFVDHDNDRVLELKVRHLTMKGFEIKKVNKAANGIYSFFDFITNDNHKVEIQELIPITGEEYDHARKLYIECFRDAPQEMMDAKFFEAFSDKYGTNLKIRSEELVWLLMAYIKKLKVNPKFKITVKEAKFIEYMCSLYKNELRGKYKRRICKINEFMKDKNASFREIQVDMKEGASIRNMYKFLYTLSAAYDISHRRDYYKIKDILTYIVNDVKKTNTILVDAISDFGKEIAIYSSKPSEEMALLVDEMMELLRRVENGRYKN